MEIIRRFTSDQYAAALESWRFLGIDGMTPLFTSPFGDIFLEAPDGGVWFLDILGGTVKREWDSLGDLQAAVNSTELQDQFLMLGLAGAAASLGVVPGESQILSFVVPPMLGGVIDPTNLEVSDMVVTVNLFGQIHEQIKDLPPGTPIAGIHSDGK